MEPMVLRRVWAIWRVEPMRAKQSAGPKNRASQEVMLFALNYRLVETAKLSCDDSFS